MRITHARRPARSAAALLAVAAASVACTSSHTKSASSSTSASAPGSSSASAPVSASSVAPSSPVASSPASPSQGASGVPTPGAPLPTGSAPAAATSSSAQAYVRAYFAALNNSLTSHSYTELQGYFTATCRLCETTLDGLKQLTFSQETLRGGVLVVQSVGPVTVLSSGKVQVMTVTTETAGEIVGPNGGVSSSFKALPPNKVAYTLQPNGPSWTIVESAQAS